MRKTIIVVDKSLPRKDRWEQQRQRYNQIANRSKQSRRWLNGIDKTLGMSRRAVVWMSSNGVCGYCGMPTNPFHDFTVDHIVPLCENGTDDYENLMPCCSTCNYRKAGRSLEWLRKKMGVEKFAFEEDWWLV